MQNDRVISIITLYNPKTENYNNIERIRRQSDIIVICDNSEGTDEKVYLDDDRMIVFHFGRNLGLSKAFNSVLKSHIIEWKDSDFIMFFDQDSIIEDGHIQKMVDSYIYINEKGYKVACIGPVFFNKARNKIESPKRNKRVSDSIIVVDSIITSSMLTQYKKLKNVGFWNENIFLDMADWDLCWRFNSYGYLCCMTNSVVLTHMVGEGDKKCIIFNIRNPKPIREYYETRDCLYLFKEKYTPFRYKFRFIGMITLRPLLHFIFLNCKTERKRYIRRGIEDYKKNIHGEFTDT